MARAAECAVCVDHAESTFRVEGLCCQHEAELLTRRLGTLRGVERTSTDVVRQRLLVAYDAAVTSRGAIAEAVAETGLRAFPDDESRDAAAGAVRLAGAVAGDQRGRAGGVAWRRTRWARRGRGGSRSWRSPSPPAAPPRCAAPSRRCGRAASTCSC